MAVPYGINPFAEYVEKLKSQQNQSMYEQAPQTTALRSSSTARQQMFDELLTPEKTAEQLGKTISDLESQINSVYNQRREEIRRRYSDFPEMASSEESRIERERADALAKARTQVTGQAQQVEQNQANWEKQFESQQQAQQQQIELKRQQLAAQEAQSMNEFFRRAYETQRAQRDQAEKMGGGTYTPIGGTPAGVVRIGGTSSGMSNRPFMGGYQPSEYFSQRSSASSRPTFEFTKGYYS